MTPTNLEECLTELDNLCIDDDKANIKAGVNNLHFGLGMYLRNTWGLWARGPLYTYFEEMGLQHPDDMSAVIIDSYRWYLNGKIFNVKEAVDKYKEYWENQK